MSESLPALIASDLDGTLLNGEGELAPRTRAALEAVARAGVAVVFATGRPWCALESIRDGEFLDAVITQNGAARYDPVSGARKVGSLVSPETMRDLLTVLDRERLPGLAVAVQAFDAEGDLFLAEVGYPDAEMYREASRGELCEAWPARVLIRHAADPRLLHEEIRDAMAGRVHLTYSVDETLFEVSAAGVTKGAALAAFAAERRIDRRDVIAFGDMPNDLEMLCWAGTGLAMENAHPLIRESVPRTARANTEEGVAQYLESLLER